MLSFKKKDVDIELFSSFRGIVGLLYEVGAPRETIIMVGLQCYLLE